ncbi:ubiquitin carboxyl-terminal hydrolase 35 isoform X2 [Crotalus tigris]|uniref:ubiquitin carboxyl-terminal hydrolase 35 isoform X2 n=1 Tax=Crotalus tigris TaxID=88082 RepID=UPI00192F19CB|nr:ubiquitin carboxyl-terminal hydrolase 35 isoform X2 [Crotalus tigris]
MDKILEAILASSYPDHMKQGLVRRIIEALKRTMDTEQCWSMLELSTKLFLLGDTKFKRSVGKEILEVCGLYHQEAFEEFFNAQFLLSLLQEGYGPLGKRSLYVFDYIHLGLPFVMDGPSANDVFSLLRTEVLRKICERPGLKQCVKISKLLTHYPLCVPTGKRQTLFCQQLIRCIGQFHTSSGREDAIMEFLDQVIQVTLLLQKIWKTQMTSILPSLKELFTIISTIDQDPSIALASVVQYVPLELMDGILRNLTNDDSITDLQMMTAIGRMIEWVSWPLGKNLDKWIIALLKNLAAVKRFSILMEVTLSKIERVFSKLLYPILREGAVSILRYMLLSFQHSHEAFHLLLPHIPRVVAALQKENSNSASRCLDQLAELIHCMFFCFSGFPDLYEPLVEAIKAVPIPNEDRIKHLLGQNAWTSQKNELANLYPRLASKSDTGKIGLINLGNTCYMNSILQALFMASDFRRSVLNLAENNSQPLAAKLQWLFAFLEHSQRPAISPENFLLASWPPWFSRGAQQDCSEYLKYLLDRLHEEERTGRRICQKLKACSLVSPGDRQPSVNKTLVEEMFGGKIKTKIRCLKCLQVSSREEAFTDLSLAFPPADDHKAGHVSSASIRSGEETGPEISPSRIQTQSSLKDLPARSGILRALGQNPSKSPAREEVVSKIVETSFPLISGRDSVEVKPIKESDLALQKQVSGCRASRSVPDLINYFLSPEMLTAENKYHCENCASLQDAEKLTELTQGPHYLILTLLRFSFDLGMMRRKKILDNVSVPLILKLPVLVSSDPGKTSGWTSSCKDFASVVYDLCSVVVHSGVSSESGHYYCYARECEDPATESPCQDNTRNTASTKSTDVEIQWYIFNDTRVVFSSFESVSNVTSFLPKDTAYLLFYRQRGRQASNGAGPEPSWTNRSLHSPDKNLMDAIAKDNILFLQEQEKEARNRNAYISALPKSSVWWKDLDRDNHDDEDDEGATGGCSHDPRGGGSGSFHGLVF